MSDEHGQDHHPSSRERVHTLARRRRRNRRVRSVTVFLVTAVAFVGVMIILWPKFQRTILYRDYLFGQAQPEPEGEGPILPKQFEGGFHRVDEDYWTVFDSDGDSLSAPSPPTDPEVPNKPGPGRPGPHKPRPGTRPIPGSSEDGVSAEGLKVTPMEVTTGYSINGDMGGLIAARVGVWRSPNKLGTGRIAFYCEHMEEVTITHWVQNLLGFRVYRITKAGRAGWVLGNTLLDADDQPLR